MSRTVLLYLPEQGRSGKEADRPTFLYEFVCYAGDGMIECDEEERDENESS